jgi:hypothetical protein
VSFVDDPSFGGLDLPPLNQGTAAGGTVNLPTAPFRSGPATAPAAPSPTPAPPTSVPPSQPSGPATPSPAQVDPRQQLAELLSPVPGHPLLRKGKVVSIDTTGTTWAAYVETDGYTETPRRMTWNGNGSKPAVDDAVYYYNASPVPVIIGRVPTANQDQDFGTGTVNAGDFVDGSGSIRTDLSGTQSSLSGTQSTVSSLSSTVSSHTSSISSLNSTVSGHTSTLSSHTTSINSLNNTVSSHTSNLAFHTSQIQVLNNRVFIDINAFLTELYNRMANVESRLTAGGH